MKITCFLLSSALLLNACGGASETASQPSTPVLQNLQVYTLGDSETAGFTPCNSPTTVCYTPELSYPSYLQEYLGTGYIVHNVATGGSTATDILRDQLPKAIQGKANIIILMDGVYDHGHISESEYLSSNTAIVQQAKQIGAKVIILGPIWPLHNEGEIILQRYAAIGQSIAQSQNVLFVNLHAADHPEWWTCADVANFHPCPSGYKGIAKIVADAIATLN